MVSFLKDVFASVLEYLGLWKKKANILLLGLDNSGKSSLLFMLKNYRMSQMKLTGQPYLEELQMGNIRFMTYDFGDHETARTIWKDCFPAVDGVFFLVDCADSKRFKEAKNELENVVKTTELANSPIAVLGNKIDMNGAVSEEDLLEHLGFASFSSKDTRPMELFMCSVAKKIGFAHPIKWMTNYLKDDK